MYGSKNSKPGRKLKLHDWFKNYKKIDHVFLSMINYVFFWIWNKSTMANDGVSRGRSVALVICDRWKVTCDMCHVTCDM